ncbi:hypothetical protein FOVG_02085 [Fusarium oxysporum f. sp. pisi HDV247]|uniref:Uncharacterized protein n=2 Tax=Fusarium oxysporum TaxID=5507 RepID=W9QAU8_FUSOX|nr:hypothetical protein FOVG_02085 [Fusarium oxysporum f. sp. pisi HDV247]
MNQERREQIAAALQSVAQELRMQAINELIEVPESIKLPRDVLDEGVIFSLISSASLEGVDDDPVDPSLSREYFAGLKAKIEERGVEIAEFPPADLEYLCTLKMKNMTEAVCVPVRNDTGDGEHNQLTWLWEEWEIAIAFKIGGGPRGWGGSYALYCKSGDKEQWKWRYGVYDKEGYSDVYENVEGFLGFYAHINEQTEEELEDDITSLSALV